MKKINDFGAKIGGAKKDMWALFNSLSEEEQNNMAQKAKLWRRPNYQSMIDKGIPKEVCFWQNKMRKAVQAKSSDNPKEYVSFILNFKEDVEQCTSMDAIKDFYNGKSSDGKCGITRYFRKVSEDKADRKWTYANDTFRAFIDGTAVLRYVYSTKRIFKDCQQEHFMASKEEKEKAKYHIMEATSNNLKTEKLKNGRFKNTVLDETCMCMFVSNEDMNAKRESSKEQVLYIVFHESKIVAVCEAEDDAEREIEHQVQMKNENSKKKETFLPPHLSVVRRTGSDYNFFRMTDGNILIARYGLRGGEFGNYTTAKDRLGGLNMTYDAFEDLYHVLGISPKDIGLGGDLAIAFGARGRGNAMAHYEPEKNVINMTKFRGAGSLAHEWAHAMDMYFGKKLNVRGFLSNNVDNANMPSAKALMQSFMEQDGKETEFYKGSCAFDGNYKKSGNGYWSSSHEMFARAFACYVKDKLQDTVSDYLVGHSECAVMAGASAIPKGCEREIINAKFDAFFAEAKQLGFFTENTEKNISNGDAEEGAIDLVLYESGDGQLMFC